MTRAEADHEPDYRFTLANERTFLAWIRTGLAIDAAGLAVVHLLPRGRIHAANEILGLSLIALGTVIAAASYVQWRRNQAALRRDAPLPESPLLRIVTAGMIAIAVIAAVIQVAGLLAG